MVQDWDRIEKELYYECNMDSRTTEGNRVKES